MKSCSSPNPNAQFLCLSLSLSLSLPSRSLSLSVASETRRASHSNHLIFVVSSFSLHPSIHLFVAESPFFYLILLYLWPSLSLSLSHSWPVQFLSAVSLLTSSSATFIPSSGGQQTNTQSDGERCATNVINFCGHFFAPSLPLVIFT